MLSDGITQSLLDFFEDNLEDEAAALKLKKELNCEQFGLATYRLNPEFSKFSCSTDGQGNCKGYKTKAYYKAVKGACPKAGAKPTGGMFDPKSSKYAYQTAGTGKKGDPCDIDGHCSTNLKCIKGFVISCGGSTGIPCGKCGTPEVVNPKFKCTKQTDCKKFGVGNEAHLCIQGKCVPIFG